jgi:hypothetical protein
VDRPLIDSYILYRTDPDNDNKEDSFFVAAFGFSLQELRLAKKQHPEWAKQVLELRRERYSEQLGDVDKALFQAAKCGDTKAADLLYRRFDGWNPRVVEQTNNFYNFSDIVKELKGIPSARRPAE